MRFLIIKTSNEINDNCIANGLCKLLDDNEIRFNLKNLNATIEIDTEDFNIEDLIYIPITIEDCYNVNSSLSRTKDLFREQTNTGQLPKLNNFMENNLIDIFKYYNTLDEKYLNDEMILKDGALNIGSHYYTLSIRGNATPKSLKIESYKRHLAFLGWIYSTSYISNKEIEINSILIPKETQEICKPFQIINKENKIITVLKGEKENILMAEYYLETLKEYNFIHQNYEKIIFLELTKNSNKPLPNKSFDVKIYNWCNELCESFLKVLRFSNIDDKVKYITAQYVLCANSINFNKLIKIYAKYNQKINKKFMKEILNMYDNKYDICTDEVVSKLGNGLNRLFYYNNTAKQKKRNRCYEIQVQLLNVRNKFHIQKTIMMLLLEYNRVFKYELLNSKEKDDLFTKINSNQEAQIYSIGILAQANVFVDFEKIKKNNTINNENQEEIINE